jgi:ubiquinone/menaquinone biosynthesis C-methylase UbiE
MKTELKGESVFVKKKQIHYVLDEKGHIIKYKPWLGDIFSFLYDRIMEKSIFPGKFNADIDKHIDILRKESSDIHLARILEIATGSGNAALFLNKDNNYTGIDISPGLLRRAYSRFKESGFEMFELYVSAAENLPFPDRQFEFAFCHLSLNFFTDIELFIRELKRVLRPGATFFCSVPVQERKPTRSTIHGTLYTEYELKTFFESGGFSFDGRSYENGAVLYFSAKLNAD